jgi:hypothetical protein
MKEKIGEEEISMLRAHDISPSMTLNCRVWFDIMAFNFSFQRVIELSWDFMLDCKNVGLG